MVEDNLSVAVVPMFGGEISPYFEESKDKESLRGWLCRAYFAEKHKGEVYYNPSITSENVLEYITSNPKKFPQTPFAIASLWKFLPSLREDLSTMFAKEEHEEKAAANKRKMMMALEAKEEDEADVEKCEV